MKSFKEFLLEVVSSKRQNMKHFTDMKPVEFIQWLWSVDEKTKGILSNIKITLKVDGMGFHFGKDITGKKFVEGSRTGPIFEPKAFSTYAKNKGSDEEIIIRAQYYDDIYDLFQKTDVMDAVPNNTKIYCEIFYNPMAQEDESGIKFVTVRYDKNKLGSLMTILPYAAKDAKTGQVLENSDEIIAEVMKKSNSKIKIVSPKLKMNEIDISGMIDPIRQLDKESVRIVQSRKKEDREAKEAIIQVINKVKHELYNYIMFNKNIEGLDRLCDPEDNEGICLYLPHGTFKMTSQKFQQAHHGSSK